MAININVCKDCVPPERYIGCHSKCNKYKNQKSKRAQVVEKIKAEKRLEQDLRTKKARRRGNS